MNYPGGKNSTYRHIINQMPSHRVYIEPFLGSGAVLRHKKPALDNNIGVDVSEQAVSAARKFFADKPAAYNIFNCSALGFLELYNWQGGEFVYLDPPYTLGSRKNQSSHLYLHEFFIEDHERLLALAKQIPAKVAISGYHSELYARELKDWRVITWQAITRGGSKATEYMWMNYPEPLELHDYRFLGSNFREREQITRQQKRWRAKLEQMPAQRRYALLSVLEELKQV